MACDPVRQNFKEELINEFYDSFQYKSGKNYFISIGKPLSWGLTGGTAPDESNDNPTSQTDSYKKNVDFWRYALAHKRIRPEDVALVIPKYEWVNNTVYVAYRDDADLFDDLNPAKFYVLVDRERVYKCIDNNYNSPSTITPTHTDSKIRKLSDGYQWKFMYQISESKRVKFLTNNNGSAQDWMPVEYIKNIEINDDRILQWRVQNEATPGSLDFIEINKSIKPFIQASDHVVFPNTSNQLVLDVTGDAVGGMTTVYLGTSNLKLAEDDYYKNMVLSIDSGQGVGQKRLIDSSLYTAGVAGGSMKIVTNTPFDVSLSAGSNGSIYSIEPYIKIEGDGSSRDNTLNTQVQTAWATSTFSAAGTTGITANKRYLESVDIVDSGKNYSYATATVVKGMSVDDALTGANELLLPRNVSEMTNLLIPVISPRDGHGSNPVKELGCSSLLIDTTYDRDEDGEIRSENDFRQFALLRDLELTEKYQFLYLKETGISGSFVIGDGVTQGLTSGAGVTGYPPTNGNVIRWTPGFTGHPGTAELVVSNIDATGDFKNDGVLSDTSFTILRAETKTLAGDEGYKLTNLRVVPGNSYGLGGFLLSTDPFARNMIVEARGHSANNIEPSHEQGRVYDWKITAGNQAEAILRLYNTDGEFNVGESLVQHDPYGATFTANVINNPNAIAEIANIGTSESNIPNAYDQTTHLTVIYDGINTFDRDTFTQDSLVKGISGDNIEYAKGYVIDWNLGITAAQGQTGDLYMTGVQGKFNTSHTIDYITSGGTGATATINKVKHSPEIKYGSGKILHIQNMKPVSRSFDQKENIKFLVRF